MPARGGAALKVKWSWLENKNQISTQPAIFEVLSITKRKTIMARRNPNAPSRTLWLVALVCGFLGILARFVQIPEISQYNYWLLLIGFILLVIGTSARRI
jgi:uncharacterized membrane protein YoaK (UPF0700 family)